MIKPTLTFNPKFATFAEWKISNTDFIESLKKKCKTEDCPDCGGTGLEHCFSCGQDYSCNRCDGEGVIESDYKAKAAFVDQLAKDKAALRRYQKATEEAQ